MPILAWLGIAMGLIVSLSASVFAAEFPAVNGAVRAAAYDSGQNIVYIGGDFTGVAGQPRERLAALNGTTGALLSWSPSVNASVNTITVDGSRVYVGGRFTEANGDTSIRRLAAFDFSGGLITAWRPRVQSAGFPPGLDPLADPARVNAIQVFGGRVVVGGLFTQAGALARRHLVAFSESNGALDGWNPLANSEIFALAARGSTLFVGGDFTGISGASRGAVAAYGSNLSLEAFNPNVTRSGSGGVAAVKAIAFDGSTLVLGGSFNRVGGATRENLALVNSNGEVTGFSVGNQVSASVTSLVVSGGIIYVASSSGNSGQALAFNSSGVSQTWQARLPGGAPLVLADLKDEILVGGTFSELVGVARVDSGGGGGGDNPPANGKPIVKIVSKDRVIRVTGPRFRIRGTAAISEGKIRRVEVKVGKSKFRRAKGAAKWNFRGRVSEGRTVIRVRAVGTNGKRSNMARIPVVRG